MLKKNSALLIALSALSLLLFGALILLLICVDVRAIGPLDSSVGLASLNGAVRDLVGESPFWYNLSEVSGLLSLAVAAGFALLGLFRLFRLRFGSFGFGRGLSRFVARYAKHKHSS